MITIIKVSLPPQASYATSEVDGHNLKSYALQLGKLKRGTYLYSVIFTFFFVIFLLY